MLTELECHNCDVKMEVKIHGKQALAVIQKYDTVVMGKPYCFRCICGHDLHLKDREVKI